MEPAFTEEQAQYLQGFLAGSAILQRSLPVIPSMPAIPSAPLAVSVEEIPSPDRYQRAAQDRFIAQGQTLTNEDQAKRKKHPLDMWPDIESHAAEAKFPKGTDVFAFKYHGLFYVAPAQDAFMCRLRFAGGAITSAQLRGVADLAEDHAGGYADVTTRANLQLREIRPEKSTHVLDGVHDLGIVNRGAGADNVRNITASPTSGFDPQELIETLPLAKKLHHYILNHREMFGLPRKFNVAFDGGGTICALDDTNDISFAAVRVGEGKSAPAGIYFRMSLGGITGHKDFARDTGLLLKPEECLPAAVAAIKAFMLHGDRTDRKKARLKYVLDTLGFDKFIDEMNKHLPAPFRKAPITDCDPRPPEIRHAHVGIHPQKNHGLHYVGVVLPAGRMRADQMRGLADIADRYGSGALRLTVWQNLLIPDIAEVDLDVVERELANLGLSADASSIRAGLVACTGNAGCKFSATNTKSHALRIADYLEPRLSLDQPVNIHLTGCPHSCAQHYIGDIGLLGTKVAAGDDMLEGYHIYVGGGYGQNQSIGRELYRDVLADDAPGVIERILRAYLDCRSASDESFQEFVKRHSIESLKELFSGRLAEVA
jgi:ferredoxin-nitrite reductase